MRNDYRENLTQTQRSFLECLDRIMGRPGSVFIGYEGEPLHFQWSDRKTYGSFTLHFPDYETYDNSFDLTFYNWESSFCDPDDPWLDRDVPDEEIEAWRKYRATFDGVPFGCIPAHMVKNMKHFKTQVGWA
jgi:hypothetical protein